MVKELRLAGISTIAAANAWLPGFIAAYNARFGRRPANAKDLHRRLTAEVAGQAVPVRVMRGAHILSFDLVPDLDA